MSVTKIPVYRNNPSSLFVREPHRHQPASAAGHPACPDSSGAATRAAAIAQPEAEAAGAQAQPQHAPAQPQWERPQPQWQAAQARPRPPRRPQPRAAQELKCPPQPAAQKGVRPRRMVVKHEARSRRSGRAGRPAGIEAHAENSESAEEHGSCGRSAEHDGACTRCRGLSGSWTRVRRRRGL